MRFTATAALVAALAATAAAAPAPKTHALHEKRQHIPHAWHKRDRVESGAMLPMRVGLKQGNLHKGYSMLMDVAQPGSINYGKHYTAGQVNEIFKPADETVDSVRAWLEGNGIDRNRVVQSDNLGWLAFDATVDEAESLLTTEYYDFEHTDSGFVTAACDEYHLPKHVQKHVDYVTPGIKLFYPGKVSKKRELEKRKSKSMIVNLPRPAATPPNPSDLSTCDTYITPACVKALYAVPNATLAQAGNALGIFEEGDVYAQASLDAFFQQFRPDIPQGTHPTLDSIDGGKAPVAVGNAAETGESDLDFELALPLVYPQKINLFQTDDTYWSANTRGFLNTFLDALDGSYCTYAAFGETGNDATYDPVYPDTNPGPGTFKGQLQCGVFKPTNVISVSYGEQENQLPPYYQQRQCNEFMKLSMQGVSVLFASGDSGVQGRGQAPFCLNGGKVFSPGFPVTCPYLTAVGATEVAAGNAVTAPEVAAQNASIGYYSGGGFSNIYSAPDYQAAALATYFANHDPGYKSYSALKNATGSEGTIGANGGVYNRVGRGYPDVSANGNNIAVYFAGKFAVSGGTSASTPIFASIVNLINEQRIKAGKATVGFLNPALYGNPSMLNDITSGNNAGCGTRGFEAVQGWDPVTGLGTPNYPKMLSYFMGLP